jgi:hypothetical protein
VSLRVFGKCVLIFDINQLRNALRTAADNDTPRRGRPVAKNVDDLFVYLLMFARMGWPYYALAKVLSISNGALQRNIIKCRDAVSATVGRRLFHLQRCETVRANLPKDWPERFSNTLLIGDGHPKSIHKSGTFIVQRITYSPYKSENIFLWVICKWFIVFRNSPCVINCLQSFLQMV